jgi:hypothetical protein
LIIHQVELIFTLRDCFHVANYKFYHIKLPPTDLNY